MQFLYALNLIKSATPGAHGNTLDQEAKRAFRARQLEVAHANPKGWPWLRRTAWARNSGGYNTGSLALTQDSRVVTLTSGTFPNPCAGWLLGATRSGEETYRILSRDSDTQVTLERPYEAVTGTGLGFKMYDPFSRVPSDLYAWEAITLEADGRVLKYETMGYVRGTWPKELGFDQGYIAVLGKPSTSAAYSAGTVTVVKGSAAVTASGATFPEWVTGHWFRLANDNVLYTIQSRDSDTALTLDRTYGGQSPGAGKSYFIDPPGGMQIEVIFPRKAQYAVKIDYFAEPQELVNDSDEIEGPESYANILIDLATADVLMAQVDPSRLTPEMSQNLFGKARMYQSRAAASLASMMGATAPAPEGDAVLKDIRYARGRGSFGPLSKSWV